MPLDTTYLLIGAPSQAGYLGAHIVRDLLHLHLERTLFKGACAHKRVGVRGVPEIDVAPGDIEGKAGPRRVVVATEVLTDRSQFLEREVMTFPKQSDRVETHDVSERVNFRVRTVVPLVRDVLRREEVGLVPIPQLAERQGRQAAHL